MRFPLCAVATCGSQGKPEERGFEFLMMRPYEVTFIVRLDLADENQINTTVEQVRGWIEAEGLGQVKKIDRWGRRKLAYEIEKQREGFYVLMESQIEPKAIREIERNLNLSPFILRHLVISTAE